MDELIRKAETLRLNLKEYQKNLNKRVAEILSLDEVSQGIINLIQDRLFNTGILADGEKLITDSARYQIGQKAYSLGNKRKADFDHVTLYVSGDWYESWLLRVGSQVSNITSDGIGTIYENFQDTFSSSKEMMDKIGTLTPEEIQIVSSKIILPYIEADLQRLIKNV